jgi:hypothetical protein
MIKFFRKIRQNLLLEGKTGTYLKYAIGEILLVVIGILIALQVNNWNELRKTQRSETQFIENITSDLKRDRDELRRVVDLANRKVQIFQQMESELPGLYYSNKNQLDSLMMEFLTPLQTFYPLTGTFDAAVSGNEISAYRNEVFKSRVFNVYNALYSRLNRNMDIIIDRWDYFVKTYKYERLKGEFGQMDDADLKELIGDLAYMTTMYEFYRDRLLDAELEIQVILDGEN